MTDEKQYFIKCGECEYLTEILNKNQTWCPNCTKRFSDYYKGWQPKLGKKNLDNYKESVCLAYSNMDIKQIVYPNNKKSKITEPTDDQFMRRAYIKEGIPLDRGGNYEWSSKQQRRQFLFLLIMMGFLFFISYLFDLY